MANLTVDLTLLRVILTLFWKLTFCLLNLYVQLKIWLGDGLHPS